MHATRFCLAQATLTTYNYGLYRPGFLWILICNYNWWTTQRETDQTSAPPTYNAAISSCSLFEWDTTRPLQLPPYSSRPVGKYALKRKTERYSGLVLILRW